MALDQKKLLVNKHSKVLDSTTPANRRKILNVYNKIADPIIYTSYLLQVTRTVQLKRLTGTTPLEIYDNLKEKLQLFGNSKITKEQLTDSVDFFEKYNGAVKILMEYKKRFEYAIPYIEFMPHMYHSDFLKFVLEFDKTKYPLMNDWDEFIMALPNNLARNEVRQAQICIYDYFKFVKYGKFDKWYQLVKGYGKSAVSKRSWVEMYIEELEENDDAGLQAEYKRHGWGQKFVVNEINKRKERDANKSKVISK